MRYSNCLIFAVLYRLRHAGSRLAYHRGRWWACVPHFYVVHGDRVLDFKSQPFRNGTPFLFRGRPRIRTKAALDTYLKS